MLVFLMTFLFVGGIYWLTLTLDDPQKALAFSQKIAPIAQSPYFIPAFFAFIVGIMLMVMVPIWWRGFNQNQLRKRLLVEGVSTTAEIIRIADTRITVNKNPKVKITVAILDREASFELLVSRVNIPRIGDWIAVIYDPKDPQKAVAATD